MAIEKAPPEKTSTEAIINQDIFVEKPWIIWVLMFLFWTLFSTALTVQDYIIALSYPEKYETFSWINSALYAFPYFYPWLALTPLIFWFRRKFRFSCWIWTLLVHLLLCLLTVTIYLWVTSAFMVPFVFGKYDFAAIYEDFSKRVYQVGHFQMIVYWAIFGVGFSLDYYKKYREREFEASRLLLRSTKLEAQLAKAQLDSLKMQLHPHFLFNTLHAISALIEDNPKRARRMIARLGELLRSTLDIAEQQTITLEKEIALTKLYLEIEQERFGDMLQVKIDVSPEELECSVPSLILQPLIENAIKHGITDEEKAAVIEIKVLRRNNRIDIFVTDNGPGFSENQTIKLENGIGLSNTKARLEQLYGKDHGFSASNSEKGGARIEISIPCKKTNNKDESK